jgi:hypothetical protein
MPDAEIRQRTYCLGSTAWCVVVESPDDFRSGQVVFRGMSAGSWTHPASLRPVLALTLDDGSTLTLRRVRIRGFRRDLDIRRNGIPLTGSAKDPARKLADASGWLLFVASLSALVALLAVASPGEGRDIPYAIAMLVVAVIYGVLGWRARRRSIAALGTAIGLVTLNALLASRPTAGTTNLGYLIGALGLIAIFGRGIVGVRQLNAIDRVAAELNLL